LNVLLFQVPPPQIHLIASSYSTPLFFISAIGCFELYYGVKFMKMPTSDVLSFESNSILLLSLVAEMYMPLYFQMLLRPSSIPQWILGLVLIQILLYMIFFLLELKFMYSEYYSRPKNIPEYVKEKYRRID